MIVYMLKEERTQTHLAIPWMFKQRLQASLDCS